MHRSSESKSESSTSKKVMDAVEKRKSDDQKWLSIPTRTTTTRHDLSSNTLSVDSGLSVPTTATTSDLESSDKSSSNRALTATLYHNTHPTHSSSSNKNNNSNSSNENLLVVLPSSSSSASSSSSSSSSSSCTSGQHYLRRQKRMLALLTNDGTTTKYNDVEDDDDDLTDLTKPVEEVVASSTAAPPSRNQMNLMKQFSESDALYLDSSLEPLNTSTSVNNQESTYYHHQHHHNPNSFSSLDRFYRQQRNSIKSFAPLAPTSLAKPAPQPNPAGRQVMLVPYETDHVPAHHLREQQAYMSLPYQRSTQQQPPAPKLDSLVTSAASLLPGESKSTLTEKRPVSKRTAHPHASRRSIVKISLDPSTTTSMGLVFEGIQAGLGLASSAIVSKPCSSSVNTSISSSDGSSSTSSSTNNTTTTSQHSSTNTSSSSLNIANENSANTNLKTKKQVDQQQLQPSQVQQTSSSKVYITYSPTSGRKQASSVAATTNSFRQNNINNLKQLTNSADINVVST